MKLFRHFLGYVLVKKPDKIVYRVGTFIAYQKHSSSSSRVVGLYRLWLLCVCTETLLARLDFVPGFSGL